MAKPVRVALLVESSHVFGRKVLQGVAAYAKMFGPWQFHFEERAFEDPVPAGMRRWKPDGIIARITTPQVARQIRGLGVPVVNLYEQLAIEGQSAVFVNHEAVVRLAVEHLRECGFQNFAYVGYPNAVFSERRAVFFCEWVTAWGFAPHVFQVRSTGRSRGLQMIEAESLRREASLARWLRKLPKPIGLMACNDMRAQQVLALCNEEGIGVPDTVGVIGVDNDELRCDLVAPSLSSVDPGAHHAGYEAAALLDQRFRGNPPPAGPSLIEPAGVVRRSSTDVFALDNPEISAALHYIRENACGKLSIRDLLKYSGLSRATLDRQFVKHLGWTPRAEITRVRVERVRELLTTSDLPLKKVAHLGGFPNLQMMYRALRKTVRQTPAGYRRTTSRRSLLPEP